MQKIQKHIEIVRTSTPGLSSLSLDSANALCKALGLIYKDVGITDVSTQNDLDQLVLLKPDLVFLGMKQLRTSTGIIWLSDFLDSHDIPYTGSTQNAHMLEIDKSLAKICTSSAGLKTSPYFVAIQGIAYSEDDIPFEYPVFIKPTNRGGGQGIDNNSVARNFTELQQKVKSISKDFDANSLIEMFLVGREFSVAVLKEAKSDEFMIMPLELIAPVNVHGHRVLSSAVKSSDTETFIAVKKGELRDSISKLALNAFHALGARDYGRIDIRLDGSGTPHFLEANLMPSILKDYGNFPKACMLNNGISYEEVIQRIVNLAFDRSKETEATDLIYSDMLTSAALA